MKRQISLVVGLLIAVMLIVLFVPGIRGALEQYLLSWLGRLAR